VLQYQQEGLALMAKPLAFLGLVVPSLAVIAKFSSDESLDLHPA
jgi:hypothetical protein